MSIALGPGLTVIHGANGQGKSNLLEAVYMLVIGKSSRTSTERDVVLIQPIPHETHTQVIAEAEQAHGRVKVMIGFRVSRPETGGPSADPADADDGLKTANVYKYIRVNGLPRRASELVGEVSGVMFGAQDLGLVYGSPSARRRYLDIINSQIDGKYLRSLQRYQRVVRQRNFLLKSIRAGRASPAELKFWDEELVAEGSYIMFRRRETVLGLAGLTKPINAELTGSAEQVDLEYVPSVPMEDDGEKAAAERLAELLEAERGRDVASGVTGLGPHRDDLRILVDRRDAAAFASRGQARTAALALKLAEARHLRNRGEHEPIILLDDVLSELDPERRELVLGHVSQYEQCLITTADPNVVDTHRLGGATRLEVRDGSVREGKSNG